MAKAFKTVDRLDVARYYLTVELRNVVDGDPALRNNLTEHQLWRVLEALSFTFRANGIFHLIANRSFDWYHGEIAAKNILLTGMSPAATKLIYSDKIKQNPLKLRDFLADYFKKHPDSDPLVLNDLRPQTMNRQEPIIVLEKEDHFVMYDGAHRLISWLLQGNATTPAFIARPNGQPDNPVIGDSHFLQLRQIYQKTTDTQQQEALLQTVTVLLEHSPSGREAIQQYWINSSSPSVVRAGKRLLGRG